MLPQLARLWGTNKHERTPKITRKLGSLAYISWVVAILQNTWQLCAANLFAIPLTDLSAIPHDISEYTRYSKVQGIIQVLICPQALLSAVLCLQLSRTGMRKSLPWSWSWRTGRCNRILPHPNLPTGCCTLHRVTIHVKGRMLDLQICKMEVHLLWLELKIGFVHHHLVFCRWLHLDTAKMLMKMGMFIPQFLLISCAQTCQKLPTTDFLKLLADPFLDGCFLLLVGSCWFNLPSFWAVFIIGATGRHEWLRRWTIGMSRKQQFRVSWESWPEATERYGKELCG